MSRSVLRFFALAAFAQYAIAACVPDVPDTLLTNNQILKHPVVIEAFEKVEKSLQKPYEENTTRDGLSFAIIHTSSPTPIYTFNAGALKFNETSLNPSNASTENTITSDSIFRVASVTKNFAMASVLILARISNNTVTLDTPIRTILPSFHLQPLDWLDGGSEITLGMLASHMSGVTRESFSTDFNQILNTGKATADSIGDLWAAQTTQRVIQEVQKTGLMFRPGERAAYSNAGIGLLGAAVASYYNKLTSGNLTWSQLVTREIFEPLNMTHSFLGPIPDSVIPDITVPGGENWADLVIGEGYNPAAGMWSSANDLSKYIHALWLQPSPSLISPFSRRRALKPVYSLPDGAQQVGPGWEISLRTFNTSSNTSSPAKKTYSVYGKSGSGGGWRSWIDVVPNLGYGLVILSQSAGLDGYEMLFPAALYGMVQDLLVPAFAEVLLGEMETRYAGVYASGRDTGVISDVVSGTGVNATTYARLEVKDQVLYMRELTVNGSSALEAIDRLSWIGDSVGAPYFSRSAGVVLEPAGGASEVADLGEGAQIFRMTAAGEELCNWYDYDGYKDQNGWPLTKIVLVETQNGVELRYPPFDIAIARS